MASEEQAVVTDTTATEAEKPSDNPPADAAEAKPVEPESQPEAETEAKPKEEPEAATDEAKASEDAKPDAETKEEEKKETDPMADVPKMMKAIVQTGYGDDVLSVYKVRELPVQRPINDQVLIKVEAASVNPVDWKIAKGWMAAVMSKKFPFVIGRDCAGVVVACGPKVDRKVLSPGVRVMALIDNSTKNGTFAEYYTTVAAVVAPIPESLSFVDAAAMPLVSQTAYQCMVDKGRLGFKGASGQKVVIFGGSTSVGMYAIQIAKAFGAGAIVVTSSKEELCKSLGATKVYNYKDKEQTSYEKELSDGSFDIAFDCVGGKVYWDHAQKILKKDGRFVTIAGDAAHGGKMTTGGLIGTMGSVMNRKFWGVMGFQSYDVVFTNPKKSLPEVARLFEEGKLRVVLDKDSPFEADQVEAAFAKSMAHKASGKLVVKIDGSKMELSKDDEKKEAAKEAAKEPAKGKESVKDAAVTGQAKGDAKEEDAPAGAKDDGTMKTQADVDNADQKDEDEANVAASDDTAENKDDGDAKEAATGKEEDTTKAADAGADATADADAAVATEAQ